MRRIQIQRIKITFPEVILINSIPKRKKLKIVRRKK